MGNIVNVGPEGTFRPSGKHQTKPADLDKIFEDYKKDLPKNITLFFHGGLVNEERGLFAANAMDANLMKIDHDAIGFVWETGLMETISNNIKTLSGKKLYNKLLKILIKILSSKLGFETIEGRGFSGDLTYRKIEEELDKAIPFKSYDFIQKDEARSIGIIRSIPNEHVLIQRLKEDIDYDVQTDSEIPGLLAEEKLTIQEGVEESRGIIGTAKLVKHLSVIGYRVIKRFVKKRDHGFYPTIVEELLREFYIAELGAWIWKSMKDKAEQMWLSNEDRDGIHQYAGRYFLDKLIELKKSHPDVNINLVGHSAGSIAICNLITKIAEISPDIKLNKIVFLAPACRIELFQNAIVKNKNSFDRIRIYTMKDEYETRDSMIPYFYTRSLLYLISGILEGEGKEFDAEILGMEKFLTHSVYENDMITAVKNFLINDTSSNLVYGITNNEAEAGFQTESISHGGFDEDSKTLESINYFLSN